MSRVTSLEKLSGPAIAVAILVLLLTAAFACQAPPPSASGQASVDTEAVGDELRDLREGWMAEMLVGDVDALVSTFTDDAIRFPPNAAPIRGKTAIREGQTRLCIALSVLLFTVPLSAPVTAIRFARLITVRDAPLDDAVVLVEGTRIKGIARGDSGVPGGATVIDLRPLVGLPGLIDVHTHMSFYWDHAPGTTPWSRLGTIETPVQVFLSQENARRTLEAGATTVASLTEIWTMRSSARQSSGGAAASRPSFAICLTLFNKMSAIIDPDDCF